MRVAPGVSLGRDLPTLRRLRMWSVLERRCAMLPCVRGGRPRRPADRLGAQWAAWSRGDATRHLGAPFHLLRRPAQWTYLATAHPGLHRMGLVPRSERRATSLVRPPDTTLLLAGSRRHHAGCGWGGHPHRPGPDGPSRSLGRQHTRGTGGWETHYARLPLPSGVCRRRARVPAPRGHPRRPTIRRGLRPTGASRARSRVRRTRLPRRADPRHNGSPPLCTRAATAISIRCMGVRALARRCRGRRSPRGDRGDSIRGSSHRRADQARVLLDLVRTWASIRERSTSDPLRVVGHTRSVELLDRYASAIKSSK